MLTNALGGSVGLEVGDHLEATDAAAIAALRLGDGSLTLFGKEARLVHYGF